MANIIFTSKEPAEDTYSEGPKKWDYLDKSKKNIVFDLIALSPSDSINLDKISFKSFLSEIYPKDIGDIYVVSDTFVRIIFNEKYTDILERTHSPSTLKEETFEKIFSSANSLYKVFKDMAENIDSRAFIVQDKETNEFIKIEHEYNDVYYPDNKNLLKSLHIKKTDKYNKPSLNEILNANILSQNQKIVRNINFAVFLEDEKDYYIILPDNFKDDKYFSYKVDRETGNAQELYLDMNSIDKLTNSLNNGNSRDEICRKTISRLIPDRIIIQVDDLYYYYGYAITQNSEKEQLEIQKIDELGLFEYDEDALEQCKKDSNIIPYAKWCLNQLQLDAEIKEEKKQGLFSFLRK